MPTISSFRIIESKQDVFRGKDCTKKFCDQKDHTIKTILTKGQQESYENVKICYICKEHKYLEDRKYCKVRDLCSYTRKYRGAAHSICNSKYSIPKKIPIVFNNGSNYDYHFITKQLTAEFKKQFTCLEENTEKYINFTVPIEKEVSRTNKKGKGITKNVSCILQLIDSARFMTTYLLRKKH